MNKYLPFIARILIALIFVFGAFGKITDFSGNAGYIQSVGLPAATLLLIIAIILEAVGGLSILLGYKAKTGAWILVIYLIIVTLLMHNNFADPNQVAHFMKNMAIIGGLLYVSQFGSGSLSIKK